MKTSHPARRWNLTFAACSLGLAGLVSSAPAAVQFSDGFAYSAGPLAGDGPPAGAPTGQTAWAATSGNTQVTPGSLAYPGILSTGNKATVTGVSGNNGDISTASFSLANSSTEWVGFLVNEASGGSAPSGYAVLSLSDNGGIGPAFGLLFNENVYGIDNDTADVERSATTVGPSSTTILLVAEIDFNAGTTYLFVDPSMGAAPNNASASASLAMTSAFKASGFDEVVLAAGFNTASFDLDQIKVGTAYADVVPEPSAGWLFAAGFAVWAGWLAFTRCRAQEIGSRR